MSTLEAQVPALREIAESSNAWPFQEARKVVARLKRHPKDEVVFETGYGPSGLPHIGTFGEVARTTMVRHAFRVLTEFGLDPGDPTQALETERFDLEGGAIGVPRFEQP